MIWAAWTLFGVLLVYAVGGLCCSEEGHESSPDDHFLGMVMGTIGAAIVFVFLLPSWDVATWALFGWLVVTAFHGLTCLDATCKYSPEYCSWQMLISSTLAGLVFVFFLP